MNTLLNQLLATDEAEFERVTFHNNNPSSHTLEAQRKAIIDAKEQGKVISNAANVTLVEIYTIRDHSPSDPDGQADLPRRSAIISGFTKQIVPPRNLNYGSKIDVVWRIKTNE